MQIKLINENKLNMGMREHRQFLTNQMEAFFFPRPVAMETKPSPQVQVAQSNAPRFIKSGILTHSSDGQKMLFNNKGSGLKVDDGTLEIWNLFENRSVDEVVQLIAEKEKIPNAVSLREKVEKVVSELRAAEVLE